MRRLASLEFIAFSSVLLLVIVSVLWIGGRGVAVTLILACIASVLTFISAAQSHATGGEEIDPEPIVWILSLLFVGWTIASFLHSATRNYGFYDVLRESVHVMFVLVATELFELALLDAADILLLE